MFQVIRLDKPFTAEKIAEVAPRPSPMDEQVLKTVREIISWVAKLGDEALYELAMKFDGAELRAAGGIAVTPSEFEKARSEVSTEYIEAITAARDRIADYHRNEIPKSWTVEQPGIYAGEIVRPVDKAGVYAPGGRARYPSTVIMGVTAARVAGVPEVYVCTPPRPDGALDPHVVVAAEVAGATRVFKVGGAGAIAALAMGTDTIPKVDKIVGPGNIFVTAAKKEVVGLVGIDGLAGPSEVVILADDSAPAEFVAADLLAQAEHGSGASSLLVTWSEELTGRVAAALQDQLDRSEAANLTPESVAEQIRCLVVCGRDEAIEVTNLVAAEHVEVMTEDPMGVAEQIRYAGAVLVGPYTPAALSDYAAGPNHVLPTGGSARFASPLGVHDFMVRTSILRCSAEGAAAIAPTAAAIAEVEGLLAHKAAALLRLTAPDGSREKIDD